MEEDWDMCESILEFSGKNSKEENLEDLMVVTEEETGNTKVVKDETNATETDNVDVDDNTNETMKTDETMKPVTKHEEAKSVKKKTLDKSPGCLYHSASHRSWFQQLLNLIRGPKFLPDKYVNRVGPVVCTCNTSQDVSPEKFGEEDLRKLSTNLSQHFKGDEGNKVKGVIKHLLAPGGANASVWRLYEILEDASKGVYTRVDYVQPKSKDVAKQQEEDDDKENAALVKVREAVKLPLPNEYVTYFVGKKGVHINQLTQQFGIELSIVSPCPLRRVPYRAPDGPNVIVEVTGATQEEVDAAKEGITAKAKVIAQKREKHKKKMVEHQEWLRKKWERKRKMREQINKDRNNRLKSPIESDIMYGTHTDGGFMKELDRKAHTSKYLQYRKTGNTLRTKPAPVLEGSTCMNCLGPYNADTKKNTHGSCRYHPGYLVEAWDWVEFSWTCCHHVAHYTREDLLDPTQWYRLPLLNKTNYMQAVESLANRLSCEGMDGGCWYSKHLGKRTARHSDKSVWIWSCCKTQAHTSSTGFNKDDKRDMHMKSGCTEGIHMWRPQRNSKSSNRVKEEAKGKRGNRSVYNMTDIRKGLKNVNLNRGGGRKSSRHMVEEVMDFWAQ